MRKISPHHSHVELELPIGTDFAFQKLRGDRPHKEPCPLERISQNAPKAGPDWRFDVELRGSRGILDLGRPVWGLSSFPEHLRFRQFWNSFNRRRFRARNSFYISVVTFIWYSYLIQPARVHARIESVDSMKTMIALRTSLLPRAPDRFRIGKTDPNIRHARSAPSEDDL